MEIVKINRKEIDSKDIALIVEYLRRGETMAYPTDTIYGLGCDATNGKAIEKIYKIKGRSGKKPLLILISSYAMLKRYCFASRRQINYLKSLWPGRVSVVLKKRNILPTGLTGGSANIAVRLPKNDFLIKVIKKLNRPLVSTSLNLSGQDHLTSVQGLEKKFTKYKPDLVVDGGSLVGRPSKLIDLTDIDNVKILRK